MPSINVTIRMDVNDKKEVEKLFSDLGLTMNAAFNMFAKQAIREQSIPFKISKNPTIQLIDRNKLDELSNDSDNKYKKAYEELAK